MYTIGELGKKVGLSRGTLLYYDDIGLLKPSARTETNYRCYTEGDFDRLKQICLYRDTGMSLEVIGRILDSTLTDKTPILEKHMQNLCQEMRRLTLQRQIITRIMIQKKDPDLKIAESQILSTKGAFLKVLACVGFNDREFIKLHQEFEKSFPDEHQAFLEVLGIPSDQIAQIRECAREPEIES
jgi:DNA-binding transcriptional MerR regulator